MNLDMPSYAHETTADYLLPGFPPAAIRVVDDHGISSAPLPGPLCGAGAVALRIEGDRFA
jgi:hypothetical protein